MLFKRSAECNSGSRVLQDWNFRHQIQIKVQYLILIVCRPFSILKLLSNYPVKSAEVQKKVKAFKVFYSFKELQTYCHLISKSKEQKIKKFSLESNENFNFPIPGPRRFSYCPGSYSTVFNGAEGTHNFGDLCKYGHTRQAKGADGGTGVNPVTHPTLETTKRDFNLNTQPETPI